MASKKHKDKIARHGGYNLLRDNAHLSRKQNKVKLRRAVKMEKTVEIENDSILWKIHAKEIETTEKQPVIQLEWGWTAGMSEEEMGNYAEDAPQGKGIVKTTLDMAIELRDQLDEIISQH